MDVTKVSLGASGFADRPPTAAELVTEIDSAAKHVRSGAVMKRRPGRR